MKLADMYNGQRVRISCWEDEMADDDDIYDYRPDHWSEDGEMDEWQGATVTIETIHEESGEIYIKEDNSQWMWFSSDFEDHSLLDADNPNIKFLKYKENIELKEQKSKFKTMDKKKLVEKLKMPEAEFVTNMTKSKDNLVHVAISSPLNKEHFIREDEVEVAVSYIPESKKRQIERGLANAEERISNEEKRSIARKLIRSRHLSDVKTDFKEFLTGRTASKVREGKE